MLYIYFLFVPPIIVLAILAGYITAVLTGQLNIDENEGDE